MEAQTAECSLSGCFDSDVFTSPDEQSQVGFKQSTMSSPEEAGVKTSLQQVNESSAQYVLLPQKTVIMTVLWSVARLKGR